MRSIGGELNSHIMMCNGGKAEQLPAVGLLEQKASEVVQLHALHHYDYGARALVSHWNWLFIQLRFSLNRARNKYCPVIFPVSRESPVRRPVLRDCIRRHPILEGDRPWQIDGALSPDDALSPDGEHRLAIGGCGCIEVLQASNGWEKIGTKRIL